LQDELTHDEHDDQQYAEADQGGREQAVLADTDLADAVDERAEAERRRQHGRHVEAAGHDLPDVAELAQPDHQDQQREREHQAEHPAPSRDVQDHAGDRRAERRGHRHGQGHVAHHPAAIPRRHDRHQRGHQQRHHHRGSAGLDDPAGQEYAERRRHRGQQRAGAEHAHRQRERAPGGDLLE
jgi:hypothetical protein